MWRVLFRHLNEASNKKGRESVREIAIPVLVVSGFLGSGKTTLVRHLLEDARRA
jgi:tRNA A37 threonylcarbamoyladenosine biosynthesis protein TsaE